MKSIKKFLFGVRKEYFLALGLTVLLVISLLGYLFEGHPVPLRVAFNTDGGDVIFDHKLHTDLKTIKCIECHHNYNEMETELDSGDLDCRSCHYSSEYSGICGEEAIHKRCIGKNCMDCHIQQSVSCDFCHNAKRFKSMKEPEIVTFETDAGKVQFSHKDHSSADGYDLGCVTCHHQYSAESPDAMSMNCRQCHYNTKYMNICENADTHTRCIGKSCLECHTDGVDNCEICHKEE